METEPAYLNHQSCITVGLRTVKRITYKITVSIVEFVTFTLCIIEIDLGQKRLDPERRIKILKLLGHGTIVFNLIVPSQFDVFAGYQIIYNRQFLLLLGAYAVIGRLFEVVYGKFRIGTE